MDCKVCDGTGTCQECDGVDAENCEECEGTGDCPACEGTGEEDE